MDTTTGRRRLAPSTLTELRTRCATIARMAAGGSWSLARVHQLGFHARSLREQVEVLAGAGMMVGALLPLSERLEAAVDRRAGTEARATTAAFEELLERLAAGEVPDDAEPADAATPASDADQDAAPLVAANADIVPVREHGAVSDDVLATVRDIGTRVRLARLASGMSQGQLATAAGVGRRFVSELETGKPTLEIGRVLMVCLAAGVPLVGPEVATAA